MSTLNLQVQLKGPEHLVFTAILQPGVPQEVFEADAPSAFQVGYFVLGPFYLYFDSLAGYPPGWIPVLHLISRPLNSLGDLKYEFSNEFNLMHKLSETAVGKIIRKSWEGQCH